MKKLTHFIVLLFVALSFKGFSQEQLEADTNTYVLEGRIVDRESMKSMYLVHIMNMDREIGTISRVDGRFGIFAKIGDTIIMSSVGYEKKKVVVSKDILDYKNGVLVPMILHPLELEEVVVKGKTFARFREEFVALKVEPIKIDEFILKNIQEEIKLIKPATAQLYKGPISFLYERFNKSARLARALERNRKKYGNPDDYTDYPIMVNYFNDVEHRVIKP